jgi:hypothetical protein
MRVSWASCFLKVDLRMLITHRIFILIMCTQSFQVLGVNGINALE